MLEDRNKGAVHRHGHAVEDEFVGTLENALTLWRTLDLPARPAGRDGRGRGEVPPREAVRRGGLRPYAPARPHWRLPLQHRLAGPASMTPTSSSTTTATARSGVAWRQGDTVLTKLGESPGTVRRLSRCRWIASTMTPTSIAGGSSRCNRSPTWRKASGCGAAASTKGLDLPVVVQPIGGRGRQEAGGFRLPADGRAPPLQGDPDLPEVACRFRR